MNTLTIVTPIYKPDLNKLRRCIESIASFALIVKDKVRILHICVDASPHDNADFFETIVCPKNHVLYYINEPDQGIYDAMNKGIVNASGQFVVFLNHDDFVIPSEMAIAVKYAFQNETAFHIFNSFIDVSGHLKLYTKIKNYFFVRLSLLFKIFPFLPANHGAIFYPIQYLKSHNYPLCSPFADLVHFIQASKQKKFNYKYYFNTHYHVFSLQGFTGSLSRKDKLIIDLNAIALGYLPKFKLSYLFTIMVRLFYP